MPVVSIGHNSKRINSTSKQYTEFYSGDCKLKEPCSMQSPVFLVQGISSKTELYNYAKFENRFYWIDDIIYKTRHIQEVHCHLDPLATFQTQIKATPAWIKYGDADNWCEEMDDIRMQPELQDPNSSSPTVEDMFAWPMAAPNTNGSVIIRVLDCGTGTGGQGFKTYAISTANFITALADLTGFLDSFLPSQGTPMGIWDLAQWISNIWGSLGGSGSWVDNILSCIYLPIDVSNYDTGGNAVSTINIGAVPCNFNGYLIATNYIVTLQRSLDIPWTANANQYKFLKNPRWCTFQVYCAGQWRDIDTTDIKDQTKFGWFSALNASTGDWSARLTETNQPSAQTLTGFSGNIAIDLMGMLPVHSFGMDFGNNALKAASLGLSSVKSQSTIYNHSASSYSRGKSASWQNKYGSNINVNESSNRSDGEASSTTYMGASGVFGSFLSSGISVSSASGSVSGDLTSLYLEGNQRGKVMIRNVQYIPNDLVHYTDYCDEYGYPCNKFLTFGDVDGYAEAVGASVKVIAGSSESNKSTINSFMNSGLYIED